MNFQQLNKIIRNIYVAIVLRLILVMIIMTICRLIFYRFNIAIYSDIPFDSFMTILKGGLKFDLSATIYLNSLYILLQIIPFDIRYNPIYIKYCNLIFYITNSLGIIANITDAIYFPFALKRTTMAMFHQFSNETNMFALFSRFLIDYWYGVVLATLLIVLFIKVSKYIYYSYDKTENPLILYPRRIIIMLLILYISIVSIRGGFTMSTRPITLSNASKYITKPTQRALVLNTPFAFLRTLGKKNLEKKRYFSNEEQQSIYSAIHSNHSDTTIFTKKNIVIFILESFGRENFGSLNKDVPNYSGYTPFLDSLIAKSYVFKNAFANGRKSISAMPSVLSSIPSLRDPFILSNYSGNRLSSISEILNKEGYSTSFFHGASNGSMGFDAFTNQIGIEQYYGKNEYNNLDDDDGFWGIWDDKFFKYFLTNINQMKPPFFTSIFSLSSHHPYNVPKEFEGKFKEGELPLHRVIGYTDNALRHFFNNAANKEWYKNTIFVITADHAPSHFFMPQYGTGAGLFAIPLIIFEPNNPNMVGFNDSIAVQQADIMPSLLGILNYHKDYLAFGTDVFDTQKDHFAIGYIGNAYQIIMDNYLLQFDGEQVISLFDNKNDPLNKKNLMGKSPLIQLKLLNKLKAFIQEYNRRLIDDEMYIE